MRNAFSLPSDQVYYYAHDKKARQLGDTQNKLISNVIRPYLSWTLSYMEIS